MQRAFVFQKHIVPVENYQEPSDPHTSSRRRGLVPQSRHTHMLHTPQESIGHSPTLPRNCASPMSISAADRNGNEALLTLCDVRTLNKSRDLGPCRWIWAYIPITSVTVTFAPEGRRWVTCIPMWWCMVSVAITTGARLCSFESRSQICLHPAIFVEPLGIGDRSKFLIHIGGGQAVEEIASISSLHEKLGHEIHVKESHGLSTGVVFGVPIGKPMVSAKALLDRNGRRLTSWRSLRTPTPTRP